MLTLLLEVFEYQYGIRDACLQPLLPMSPSIFCSKGLNAPFLSTSRERMGAHITDLENNIDFTVILLLLSALQDADVTADTMSV